MMGSAMARTLKRSMILTLLILPLSGPQAQQFLHPEAGQAQQLCHRDNMISTTPASRFQKHDDGTVIDRETGLMWRACVEGVKGKNCDKGKALELSWGGAL